MKNILTLLFCSALAITGHAQNFEVPAGFSPKDGSEYSKYNKDVVNCVNWLESTPVTKEADKRKEANAFLIAWLAGSPDVSITIKPETVTFMDKNPDLLSAYMGGWARYVIETGNYTDSLQGNLAGIKSVLKVYKANSTLKRDKNVDKLIMLDNKGELEAWEAKKMKQ